MVTAVGAASPQPRGGDRSRPPVGCPLQPHVADLAATRDALVAAGATVVQDATPVGGGRTIATLTDPDGHTVGLAQDA